MARRSSKVAIALAALLGGGGLAYGASQRDKYDYNAVCVDNRTNTRVDDRGCEVTSSSSYPYHWYYVPTGQNAFIPGIGQQVPNGTGSFLAPAADSSVAKGVPTTGSKVSKGGFGGKSGTVGG